MPSNANVSRGNYKDLYSISNSLVTAKYNEHNKNVLLDNTDTNNTKLYFKQFEKYINDPVRYTEEVIGAKLWSKQKELMNTLMTNRKVLVKSSHSVGKSFSGAALVNYFFDTTQDELRGLAVAPTFNLIRDVLFKEVRTIRKTKNFFNGAKKPLLMDRQDHSFVGITVNNSQSLAGRHSKHTVAIIVDEASEVEHEIFDVLFTSLEANYYMICFFNPVNPSSKVFELESNSEWATISISNLDHPNIKYQLKNFPSEKVIIPGAITLKNFRSMLKNWSKIIPMKDKKITDVVIPDENGEMICYRPGTLAENRLLGRYSSTSATTVITDALFETCKSLLIDPTTTIDTIPVIGVDPARYGSDSTVISVYHNGYFLSVKELFNVNGEEVAKEIKEIALQLANTLGCLHTSIPINIDGIGVGASAVDFLNSQDYLMLVNDINVSNRSQFPNLYSSLRSELWFSTKEKMESGQVSFVKIEPYFQQKIRSELLLPNYSINAKAQYVVESKDSIKKRTKKNSPNFADSVNLALFSYQPNISISVL